ncbi:LPS translocon maturation chaperone LptM [Noviherbaspirillum autotrophicum]|uniref:LPS translocon maturation chaperone LptM n=1 Tax=Noviherbaspirillum autotrophicum TaxID=709839 RepID=UPI0038CD3B1B
MILIVKSFFHLIRLGAAAALLFAAAGCGQKGPLYLPAKPQPVASAPAAQPAPAPVGRTSESK